MDDYIGEERRKGPRLSQGEFHAIVQEAKKQALDEVYADIGKGVVKRILWLLGIGTTAFATWVASKGYL